MDSGSWSSSCFQLCRQVITADVLLFHIIMLSSCLFSALPFAPCKEDESSLVISGYLVDHLWALCVRLILKCYCCPTPTWWIPVEHQCHIRCVTGLCASFLLPSMLSMSWKREQLRGQEVEHQSCFSAGYFAVQRPMLDYLTASFLKFT